MAKTKYHCLFEQSGVFKNEIIKLGGIAKDYDIANDYGQTDVVCDLFEEIEREYLGIRSIFRNIKQGEYILAFFPCTRFEDQIQMGFRGTQYQLQNASLEYKLNYDLYLHKGLSKNYEIITKLAIICLRKEINLIIENPFSGTHYLSKYWCIPSSIVDCDRRKNGDNFKKPTQYWFIGCTPQNNELEEIKCVDDGKTILGVQGKDRTRLRSEITPQYAERFIKRYIAKEENGEYVL